MQNVDKIDNGQNLFQHPEYQEVLKNKKQFEAPLIADLFLYCYESQFMAKLHKDPKTDLIDKFNNTYRYLDNIFSVNNSDFYKHTSEIYPKELTLNKANNNSLKCPFLDLDVSISQGKISTKIYDKRGDYSFPIVNFPFLDGDVHLAHSYGGIHSTACSVCLCLKRRSRL